MLNAADEETSTHGKERIKKNFKQNKRMEIEWFTKDVGLKDIEPKGKWKKWNRFDSKYFQRIS